MTTTTAAKTATARYSIGQTVEARTHDFKAPGMPEIWVRATVTEVSPRGNGTWDVMVIADHGSYHPQIVGKRGGNTDIREVAQ